MMKHDLVTNIYQVEQHRIYIHMESDEWGKHLYQGWIYTVIIMRRISISSSRFELSSSNWVPMKLPMIPRHVDIFILYIFYVFNVITTVGKLEIFLSFVVICILSMNQ